MQRDTSTRSRLGASSRYLLVGPSLVMLLLAFVLPCVVVIRESLRGSASAGMITSAFGLESYQRVLTDGFYWNVVLRTLVLGLTVAVVALVLSYPLVLFMQRTRPSVRGVLLALAIAPLLVSSVIRSYGFVVLLGNEGLVNAVAQGVNLVDHPLPLMNNLLGINIGMVEVMMPFMILALSSGFGRLDPAYEEAARSLGASRFAVFRRITLPLTFPAMMTGALLVFVLTVSAFITPEVMGGGKVFVLATEIYRQATSTADWPLAAALSVFLVIVFSIVLVVNHTVIRRASRRWN